MSGETLRAAAALMRSRAEAAGQWNADVEPGDSLHLWVEDFDPSDPSGQTAMQRVVGGADAPWSEHIASWHPAVALAVADWLDGARCGLHCDNDGTRWPHCSRCDDSGDDHNCPPRTTCEHTKDYRRALAVARIYLGEQA